MARALTTAVAILILSVLGLAQAESVVFAKVEEPPRWKCPIWAYCPRTGEPALHAASGQTEACPADRLWSPAVRGCVPTTSNVQIKKDVSIADIAAAVNEEAQTKQANNDDRTCPYDQYLCKGRCQSYWIGCDAATGSAQAEIAPRCPHLRFWCASDKMCLPPWACCGCP